MAEVVELRIEQGIDELLELERAGLFSPEEVRIVIKKRKEMEYRLQRMKKCKEDYLKYISYEDSLLQLIKVRRQQIGFHHRFKEIERSIATRIAAIYKNVVYRYQSDMQLWLSYIEFCRKQKWKGTVSSLFAKMLQLHNKKEEIWVLAAKWESQFNQSIDTARSLMHQALRFNPQSRTLLREYFCLELVYADRVIKRQSILLKKPDSAEAGDENEQTDAITSGAVAAVVYETAVQRIPDPEFAIQLIQCISDHIPPLRQCLEQKLVDDVSQRFPDSEDVLHLRCEREIKSADRDNVLPVTLKVYEDAIQKKSSSRMWSFFLKSLLNHLTSPDRSFQKKDIVAALESAFEKAFQKDCLSVEMFSEWVLLHKALIHGSKRRKESHRRVLEDIIARATSKWRAVPSVWLISLSVKIDASHEDEMGINCFFHHGLERLSAFVNSHDSVTDEDRSAIQDYVEMFVKWAMSSSRITPKNILTVVDSCCSGKLFSMGTSCGRFLAAHFQSLLLTVANQIDTLDTVYRSYRKYKDRQPIDRSLFTTMIGICRSNEKCCFAGEVYEDYLNEFASDDHRIWMEYIRYMIDRNEVTAIAEVHERATSRLKSAEQVLFLTAYSALMSNL
jgi:U3 small nucleolar RNA-associated protein 6